jgi:hypothetical protein
MSKEDGMDWRSAVGGKLATPKGAVERVKSGDRVTVAPFTCTPFTLCGALYERRGELENVRVDHPAALFAWVKPEDENGFSVRDNYATPLNREMVNSGRVDYLPIGRWRADELPPGIRRRNRCLHGAPLAAGQAGVLQLRPGCLDFAQDRAHR